jgi:TolB-like protein
MPVHNRKFSAVNQACGNEVIYIVGKGLVFCLDVKNRNFTVVDRRDLDIIRQEMDFQRSGEVSDETAAGIGRKIGAQSIIFGSMERAGSLYRLSIRTVEVETAKIQAIRNTIIERDALLAVVTGKGRRTNSTGQPISKVFQAVSDYLIERIPSNSKIAVFNIRAKSGAFSNYINDNISEGLVNSGKFTVVDRRDLDIIRQEMDFQKSGEVSDETAAGIGRKIGAQSIIFGSMERSGSLYRLRIRIIEVETARIQAIWNTLIDQDALLAVLTGRGRRTNSTGQPIGRVFQEASEYLIKRIPADSKIAVFNIQAKSEALSNYINDNISASLVNSGKFMVVDRHNLDLIQAELDFQYSGEASEETVVSIGGKIGAQAIITGIVEEFGGLYRLQIRSIEVETTSIQAMQNYLVSNDSIFDRLAGKEYKKLYLGAMPGFSLHLFNTNGTGYDGKKGSGNFSIDGALSVEFFINEMVSLQTGLLYTTDTMTVSGQKTVYDASGNFSYSYNTTESFSIGSLSVPLLGGINFHPSIFALGIYGGLYADFPIQAGSIYTDKFAGTRDAFERSFLFGCTVGGSAGIKLGPGSIFFDVRYMGDFISARITVNDRQLEVYKRHIIAFGIGYKIGLINQKR